jgi:hypothetical protein
MLAMQANSWLPRKQSVFINNLWAISNPLPHVLHLVNA